MATKKLSLDDFEGVAVLKLLLVKGGANGQETISYCPPTEDCDEATNIGGGSGGCAGSKAGDPDGFGGYLDQDEVVVYGTAPTSGTMPMYSEQTGSWVSQPCLGCAELALPKKTFSEVGRYLMNAAGAYHNTGCGGETSPNNRNTIWKPFSN